MSSLLFSEKPVPPITISLADVPLDELVGLPMFMQNIVFSTGVSPKTRGKNYVRVYLQRGVFANRAGALFASAHMDAPMPLSKAIEGIRIEAWRFQDIHPLFSAALRRAEWLRHLEYPWADKVQTVFEHVVAHNDSWDDNDSQLEKQWLTLARAAEIAMGKKAKFEPAIYSDPFIHALVALYPEGRGGSHADLANRWLQDPTPTARPVT